MNRQDIEPMLKAAQVAEILGYKDDDKAREIMRQMVHMERPLRVTAKALEKWISERMYQPVHNSGTGRTQQAEDRIPRRRRGKLQGVVV